MAHCAASQMTPSEETCPICFSTLQDPHQPAGCSHACCRTCLIQSLTCLPHCPVCRAKTEVGDIVPAGDATGVRDQTITTVTRLGQPLPGLSGFSMLAAGSVNSGIQDRIRILQMATGRSMANRSPAIAIGPPLRVPRFLPRHSLSITPEDDLYMSMSCTSSPAPTTNTANPFTRADNTYMTMPRISAPTAPAPIPAPRTFRFNPRHHLRTGSAPGSQLWDIGQHTPFPSQRHTPVASRASLSVLADSQAVAALSFDDDISFSFTDDDALVRTFVCPFCLHSNLDEMELLDHCNDNHYYDKRPMVCPICVSLPYGDPNQISKNFIRHLNLRHCYNIDDYTNLHQSDTSNLQVAIFESLQDVNRNTVDS